MFTKIIGLIMAGLLSTGALTGCSTTEQAVNDAGHQIVTNWMDKNKIEVNEQVVHIQDITENGNKLIVKTKTDYVDAEHCILSNFYFLSDFIEELNTDKFTELQYWTVVETTKGGTKKMFSCTMPKVKMDAIKNKKIFPVDHKDFASTMYEVFVDEEIIKGYEESNILFQNKGLEVPKEDKKEETTETNTNNVENTENTTRTNTNKDNRNSSNKSTQRENNKHNTNKQSNKHNSTQNKEESKGYYTDCPNCGRKVWTVNGAWDCPCYHEEEENNNTAPMESETGNYTGEY